MAKISFLDGDQKNRVSDNLIILKHRPASSTSQPESDLRFMDEKPFSMMLKVMHSGSKLAFYYLLTALTICIMT